MPMSPKRYRKPLPLTSARSCNPRAIPPADSSESNPLYLRVIESGNQLDRTLASTVLPSANRSPGISREEWVASIGNAVDYYALALENYCESALRKWAPHLAKRPK